MKTFLLIISLSFISLMIFAQIPSKIDFQAVARTAQGEVMSNQEVSIQLSILAGPLPGTVVYQERHAVTTDEFGLFVLGIGSSQDTQGSFSAIEWDKGPHFVQIEIDEEGGNNYKNLGTLEMMAVPYAFYAQRVENADDADANPQNEIQQLEINGEVLTISDGNSIQLPDADPQNELQQLSFGQNNLLSISQGNSVQLPNVSSPWTLQGQSIYVESGRVGIGLTKPSNALSIYSENRATMNFLTSGSGSGQEDGFSVGLNKLSNSAILWNFERGDIHFGTDNKTRMYVSPFGSVGIGTTSPGAKLEVSSSNQDVEMRIHAAEEMKARVSLLEASTPDKLGFSWQYDGKKKNLYLTSEGFQNYDGRNIFTITPQGTVGLNTENPGTSLALNAHEAESTMMSITNDNYTNAVMALGLNRGNPFIDFVNAPLQIKAEGRNAIIVHNQSAFVGIGTLDPQVELDVTGDLLVSEDTEILGSLTIGQGLKFNQIQEFTGTTFEDTDFTNFNFPTGYNKSNTRVISFQLQNKEGNWLGIGTGNSIDRINVVLLNDKIKINHPPLNDYQKRPFRILLMRVDN